jgi:DNA polymerase-1
VEVAEAKAFIKKYFATYPGVRKFITATHREAFERGFIETLLGRKRRLPDAQSTDRMKSSLAEREAVNSKISGSAADLMKLATIKQDRFITESHIPYSALLQIHDELIYEVNEKWLQKNRSSIDDLRVIMENVHLLRVPIKVSVEILRRWGDKVNIQEDWEVEAVV